MIKYNNKDLTDTIPVKIEDIIVSPVQLTPVARQRAVQAGAEFVRMGVGERTVTISFALLESAYDDREAALQSLREWSKIDKERTLELPHFSNRHLECVCTQFPEPSYRKWWENKLKIVFTCFDNPYWTSNEQIEVPCGTLFSIGGSAQPLIEIHRNGVTPLTNQSYSDGSKTITFSTIPAGNLVIDLNRQTASIGKSSIMRHYNPLSKWIVPKIGAQQNITGIGSIVYRERWV